MVHLVTTRSSKDAMGQFKCLMHSLIMPLPDRHKKKLLSRTQITQLRSHSYQRIQQIHLMNILPNHQQISWILTYCCLKWHATKNTEELLFPWIYSKELEKKRYSHAWIILRAWFNLWQKKRNTLTNYQQRRNINGYHFVVAWHSLASFPFNNQGI